MINILNPFTQTVLIVSVLVGAWIVVSRTRAHQRRQERADFIRNHHFGLAADFRLRAQRPDLSEGARRDAWAGLRTYFLCVLASPNRFMPMPSQLVDEAWHALLKDHVAYRHFCERALGRYFTHRPEDPAHPAARGIAQRHRLLASHPLLSNSSVLVPMADVLGLFALDESHDLVDGLYYEAPSTGPRSDSSSTGNSGGCGGHTVPTGPGSSAAFFTGGSFGGGITSADGGGADGGGDGGGCGGG